MHTNECNSNNNIKVNNSFNSDGKEATCNTGDLGSNPGLRRSSGGGYSNPL